MEQSPFSKEQLRPLLTKDVEEFSEENLRYIWEILQELIRATVYSTASVQAQLNNLNLILDVEAAQEFINRERANRRREEVDSAVRGKTK